LRRECTLAFERVKNDSFQQVSQAYVLRVRRSFADHPGAGWIVDVAKGKKLDDFAEEEPAAIVKPVFLEGESPQAGRHGRTT
jgi:hypothetical protein